MVNGMNAQNQTFDTIIKTIGSVESNDQEINTRKELDELGKYLNGEKSEEFKKKFGVDLNATMIQKLKQIYYSAKTVIDNLVKDNNDNESVNQSPEPTPPTDATAPSNETEKNSTENEQEMTPEPDPERSSAPVNHEDEKDSKACAEQMPSPKPNTDESKTTKEKDPNYSPEEDTMEEQTTNPKPNSKSNANEGKKIVWNGKMCILKPNGDILDIMANKKVGHKQ